MPGSFCCGEGNEGPASGGRAYLWCVRGDWCAYFALFFVYLSILTINVTTILFAIIPMYGGLDTLLGMVHIVCFQTIVIMVLISHMSASWSDPGLVRQEHTEKFMDEYRKELEVLQTNGATDLELRRFRRTFCKHCRVPKPKGAHHCSACNRCVREMDHHCPWINNCVGERNLKMFLLFLCYTALGTAYSVCMFALRVYSLYKGNAMRTRINPADRNFYFALVSSCVVAVIAALFFFFFVMCMCYDQYDALTTGVPGIESMSIHGDIPWKQSLAKGFRVMAQRGEPFTWRWFVPIAAVERKEE